MRCFVAVDIPRQVAGEVEAACLPFTKTPGARLVPAASLHVTLAFLGEKAPEQVEKLKQKLSAITLPSFDARLSGAGFFPSESFARVLWVGIEADGLKALHGQVGKAVGIDEKFSPHLTVARLSAKPGEDVMALKKKLENTAFSPFRVEHFSLKKSELLPTGAEYSDVGTYRLV